MAEERTSEEVAETTDSSVPDDDVYSNENMLINWTRKVKDLETKKRELEQQSRDIDKILKDQRLDREKYRRAYAVEKGIDLKKKVVEVVEEDGKPVIKVENKSTKKSKS